MAKVQTGNELTLKKSDGMRLEITYRWLKDRGYDSVHGIDFGRGDEFVVYSWAQVEVIDIFGELEL